MGCLLILVGCKSPMERCSHVCTENVFEIKSFENNICTCKKRDACLL